MLIAALVDVLDAVAGPTPTVVDLGCGTGSVTLRVLERLPHAHCIAIDVDPVLLTIASATFAGDDQVEVVSADLRDGTWLQTITGRQIDAVLTATALHWLTEDIVRRLYRDLAAVVRPGGIVAHAEQMPFDDLARLGPALAALDTRRRGLSATEVRTIWDAWWDDVAVEPQLRAVLAQRSEVFAGTYPSEEFSPPADWHIAALRAAGFAEAGVVWRARQGAVVAAVR